MSDPSAACPTSGTPAASPREFSVRAPDGVTVGAQAWGNVRGAEIVLIHGFMQSHLSWSKQVNSPLATEFRMVTYDVRGHGGSDKFMDPALYNNGERFADELNAVIEAVGLKRPVLVGWSYGTRIVTDYLMKYGTGRIAGINYVGSALSGASEHLGPGTRILQQALSDDLRSNIEATRDFVRACFSRQPTEQEFETTLGFNMAVPVKIRQWLRRPAPYEATLRKIDVPVLVTHGIDDSITLLSLGQYVAATVPGARASYYPGVGHSPFWEDGARFNRELAAFVRECVLSVRG